MEIIWQFYLDNGAFESTDREQDYVVGSMVNKRRSIILLKDLKPCKELILNHEWKFWNIWNISSLVFIK